MTSRDSIYHSSWPLKERFTAEFAPLRRHLLRHRVRYQWTLVVLLVLITLTQFFRTEAELTEIHLVIGAASIHLLRGLAILTLVPLWVATALLQEIIYFRLQDRWVERERARLPGQGFLVPHWRFYIPAILVRAAMLVIIVLFLFAALYLVPAKFTAISPFVPDGYPI